MPEYFVIYDGNCNLCVTFVQLLEKFDLSNQFIYLPMQDTANLQKLEITEQDCQGGMILIDKQNPQRRWQGSDAAEEITRLLPLGNGFIAAYRAMPVMKSLGDSVYAQVRDHRYQWFGKRASTYFSACGSDCQSPIDAYSE